MSRILEHAAIYTAAGMAVLPLHRPSRHCGDLVCSCGNPGCSRAAKHPVGRLVPKGCKDASTDKGIIGRWFTEGDHNIGIATGEVSGIFALDIDARHDGDQTLSRLEQEHGELPPTWRFLTGGGGEHVIFRHPGRSVPNSASKIGEGIDVRGDGGYIVAPPSLHICGRPYAISVDHHPDEVELADAPTWLLDRICPVIDTATTTQATKKARSSQNWRDLTASHVSEGQRNAVIAQLTGHLLRRFIDPRVALNLLQAWNVIHCSPPLPGDEVLNTVRSIALREIKRRMGRHVR